MLQWHCLVTLVTQLTHQENRRQVFKWLGWRGKPCKESATALDLNKPKKRVFGNEINNYGQRENKVDLLTNGKSYLKVNVPMHAAKHYNLENKDDESVLERHSQHRSEGFVYGPFAPINVPRIGNSGNKNVKRIPRVEGLASSYRP